MENQVVVHGKKFKKILDHATIQSRIKYLAKELAGNIESESPLFLIILNGAAFFGIDLLRHLDSKIEMDFIKLSSYDGMTSKGKHELKLGESINLQNREVFIVEDILDTGHTMKKLIELIKRKGANSIKIITLLHKPEANVHKIIPDYNGFEVENLFVVGYGLDYDHRGRNLNDIYQLTEE